MQHEKDVKKRIARFCDNALNVNIRELISERKVKTDELAEFLSVSSEAVRLWQAGYARPDIDKIPLICKFFNVSSDYLLGLSSVKTQDVDIRSVCDITGLSESAVSLLMNYQVEVQHNVKGGGVATGMKKAKPPKDVSRIIESSFFREFINDLWILRNIRNDDENFPIQLRGLRNSMTVSDFREYWINNKIKPRLEGFINRTVPYEYVDGDNNITYYDAEAVDFLDELPIESRIYLDEKDVN